MTPKKILVVDDDPVILKALSLKLESNGYIVITVSDSAEAVKTARLEKPDVVLLDLNFPKKAGHAEVDWDGLTIMQWMARLREVCDIPVIAMTAGASDKNKKRAYDLGAAAFFQKPIDNQALLTTLQKLLGDVTSP